MKVSAAKILVNHLSKDCWENVMDNFFQTEHSGYLIYKRKVSHNYWRFIVRNDKTSCSFTKYHRG